MTHVGKKDSQVYHQVNVQGTQNLLNAVRMKNLIFMSTAKVYKQEGKPIDETSPLEPLDDYAKTKLEAEYICRKYFTGDHLIVLRSVNVVGIGQPDKAILPVLFNQAFHNEPLDIFAPKKSFVQFLYVEDVIRTFELFMDHPNLDGIFNLSSVQKIRLDELAFKIIQLCQSKSTIHFSNLTEAPFSEIRSDKIQKKLGWVAQTTINDILKIYHQSVNVSR